MLCCVCFFGWNVEKWEKCPQTNAFYWPSTDNFIILVAEHEHDVCVCLVIAITCKSKNMLLRHISSLCFSLSLAHSFIQLRHVKRLLHLKIISCLLDAKKKKILFSVAKICNTLLQIRFRWTWFIYVSMYIMCMRSQWEKKLTDYDLAKAMITNFVHIIIDINIVLMMA